MPIFTTAARSLVEAVEAGSIRRAAETLNSSASAVNRQILNLEAEFGVQLLERLPRGVRPTAAGRVMVERIRQWQGELDLTRTRLAELRGLEQSQITVGLMECFAGDLFADLLLALRRDYPATSILARVGGTRELIALLEAGDLDIVVGFDLPPSSDFWVIETIPVPMGVVVPPGHAFAGRLSIRLADCAAEAILLADQSLTLRPLIDAILPNSGLRPVPPLTSNSIGLIKGAIRSGAGISILTVFDALSELRAGSLVFIPLEQPGVNETLSICVRDQASVSPTSMAFCRAMIAAIRAELTTP